VKRAAWFLARRALWALVLIVGVGTIGFAIARALPGDPVRLVVGPQAREADRRAAERIYGLDRPLAVQYARFWGRLVHRGPAGDADHKSCLAMGRWHVDLGTSIQRKKGVAELIASRAPRSLELAAAAVVLQLLIGLGLGALAAARRGSLVDQTAVAAVLLGVSAPTFVVGIGLQYVLAHRLGWLPVDSAGADARAVVLPALTLGLWGAALYARLAREELSSALGADYARAARARGASGARVLWVHALRNAALPIVTLMVLDFGALVGGAIVTEKLFRWPGLGALTVDAVVNRDAPVIFGTVMFAAAAVAVATLLLDVLQLALDPRLRR
jgi:peptide/nickel transport system permease protein